MERSDWQQLEKLCRQLHEEYPDNTHPLFESVRMTGAFAASVLEHWDVSHTEPTDDTLAEYQRIEELERNKRDEDMAPEHP